MRDYLVDPNLLWSPFAAPDLPLAVIDLDRADGRQATLDRPPCPLIGIGDPEHPLAAALDCVIEPPISLDSVVRQVIARPRAAAVTVQLLRLIEGLEPAHALLAESLAYGLLQGGAEHRRWLRNRTPQESAAPGAVALMREGDTLRIRLERAWAGNAIDVAMRDGLRAAFELAALDHEIRAIELTAAGRSFSVGADLAEFGTTLDPPQAHAIRAATLSAHAALACTDRLRVHVQGACIGAGLELAAFAPTLTATGRAWFQLPELAMGLLPGAGGCVSLSRRIGRRRTALMILSGRRLDARTALEWGLIDAIVG